MAYTDSADGTAPAAQPAAPTPLDQAGSAALGQQIAKALTGNTSASAAQKQLQAAANPPPVKALPVPQAAPPLAPPPGAARAPSSIMPRWLRPQQQQPTPTQPGIVPGDVAAPY
jgi:hypothetical protein